jgi:hypothetical protein
VVDSADDERLDLLVASVNTLVPWSNLDATALRVVGGAKIGELDHSLPQRFAQSGRVLDADPDGLMESVDSSWSLIGNAIADARALANLRRDLAGHPLSHLIASFRQEQDAVAKTLEWLGAVERVKLMMLCVCDCVHKARGPRG